MSLLRRILPITDALTAAQAAVEEVLRTLTYTQERDLVVARLRETAAQADLAAARARDLARAVESGFGTLPEFPAAPEAAAGVEEVDDGA